MILSMVWNVTEAFLIIQEIQTKIRFRDITLARAFRMVWRRSGGRRIRELLWLVKGE